MTAASAQTARASGAAVVAGDAHWEAIAHRAPQMATTMHAYLDQLAVSSRPSTVEAAALALRNLTWHLVFLGLYLADLDRLRSEGADASR
jgi:hypothetical protein